MSLLIKRVSLVIQVCEAVEKHIRSGEWGDWLPGERDLCAQLEVSRNTLRSALARLAKAGVIERRQGRGNRITATASGAARADATRTIGLLSPEPLERLRPSLTLWIDELRRLLAQDGYTLHVVSGARYFTARPGPVLERLVRGNRHDAWVLILANRPTQAWFSQRGLPCVIAGTGFPGVAVPSIDTDFRALCQHAAGVLLSRGHRHLAFIGPSLAGDIESANALVAAIRGSPHQDATCTVAYSEITRAALNKVVRRLMEAAQPVTAILVARSDAYLAVATCLAQMGRRVPADVSLLSRDGDAFLAFMNPVPARYTMSPGGFARRVMRLVGEVIGKGGAKASHTAIMPDYLAGESIAGPPGR